MYLTKPQKLIYDMERFAGGSINVICGSMVLSGEKAEEELVNAAQNMLRTNDALRIRICECNDELAQEVQEYADTDIEILHFESKAELDFYAQNYAKQPLDFYGNLCELKVFVYPGHYGILAKIHHIVSDAWTLAMVGSQFNAFLNGVDPDPCSYCEYVETEKEYLQSQRFENDRTFFLEQFKKCDEVTYLSEKHADGFAANRKTIVIGTEVARQIRDYATQNKTSAYTLFMTVLAVYINRIKMNTEKFYIGTAVLNRSGAREKRTMGMFVNTVPMLMELNNEKSFAENLTSVGKTIFSAFRHQKYNYGEVLSSIRSEFGFSERLYDVMLSYQNAIVTGLSTDMESTWYHSGMQNESLQIHIDDRDNEGVFRIHYDYQTDKFTERDIEVMHSHLLTLLQDAIKNDNKKLYELELLTKDEKQKLLYTFNDTAADYPKDKCVHQLFEEQVERTPDKIAVIACDKTLTYAELNEQANRIAHAIVEKGITVGDVIAIKLARKSYLLSAMLGVLKSGAAYMPIDPTYPNDRIEYMLTESNAKYCIDENSIADFLSNSDTTNLNVVIGCNDPFCALHTSGSTGKPKMSLLQHGGMMNFITANQHFWHDVDTVVSTTIATFDAFVMDSVLSIAQNKRVVLASEEEIYNQENFEALFRYSRNNMFFSTPTKLESYITNSEDRGFLTTIQSLIVGGEIFSEHLLKLLNNNYANPIFNIYGPTECTICSSVAALYRE